MELVGPVQFTIRGAVPSESAALTALALDAKGSWGYPKEWLEQWRAELTISEHYLCTHTVFVAESALGMFGVCALEDHGTHWALEHLWVSPRAQRLGVGRALLRHALDLASAGATSARRVRVVSDPHAAGFYRAMGARQVGAERAPMPGAAERELPIMEFTTAVAK